MESIGVIMATTNLTNLKANALSNVVSTVLSTTGVSSVPKITTITYPGDDTAANTGGNQTISISGTGFNTGASVIVNGTPASVVSVVSPTSLTFTAPAQSSGTYTLYVVNTDGGTAIAVPGISYSGTPAWTTAAGSLATVYETAPVASVVDAAADVSVTYSLLSGTLPPGSSLNTSTGLISGTSQATDSPTTYSFTIRATDGQNQDTDRAFSITINPDSVTWSSPADNSTTTVYEHSAISSISLISTSAAGKNIAYTANSLPTGITLTGNTISGTPTVTGTSYTQLTATAATTNRTATRNIGFVVNQDVVTWNSPADQYVTSLAQNSAMTTFNMDASSAAGKSITYTANSLPTGLSVSGATIVGTPTVTGNSGSLITATAATTGRTATRTFNWVVSVSGDTYWPYNVLLLNGETPSIPFNADASTNALAITVNGDTKPNYFNPYTTGYYSAYFDGTSDVYTIGGNAGPIGTEDFTWECWVYISTMGGDYPRIFESSTGVGGSFQIYLSGGTLVVGGNGTGAITSYSISSLTNQWLHLCITRTGSAMRIFVNGVLRAYSGSGGNNFPSGGSSWRTATEAGGIIGYISNMRVVRGSIVSAYSTSSTTTGTTIFTPPTSPLTAISGTQFLGMQSARLIDTSSNNFAITTSGNTAVNSFDPFVLDNSYSTYGSTYFDGNGDYLTLPSGNASLQPAGSDFTIEAWVYPTTFVANGNPVAVIDANASYYAAIRFGYESSGAISLLMSTNGTTWSINLGSGLGTLTLNTWQHMAVSKSGTSVRVFLNGVQQGSTQTLSSATLMTGTNNWIGYLNAPSAQYVNGYISNWRLTKTALYTTTFTPSTTPLTAIANTSLLTCQYNQPNNNSMFLDSSSVTNIITRNGNATQGTFSPYGDDWSNYFDGTGDSLSTSYNSAFAFPGDFTIECWLNWSAHGSYGGIVGCADTNTSQAISAGWFLDFNATNNTLQFEGQGGVAIVTTNTIPANQWNHIAVVRSGSTITHYLNGVSNGSGTSSQSFNGVSTSLFVGKDRGSASYITGYISNVRVVKGTAVYTTTFTPSTTPLTAIANTSLLTCNSNQFVDYSPINSVITRNGDTSVQRFSPFGNYTVTPTSYSNFFDGTTDYLSVPSNANLAFGTGDFTVEAWVNWSSIAAPRPIIDMQTTGSFNLYWDSGAFNANSIVVSNRSANQIVYSFVPVVGTWYHIAVSRSGTNLRLFVNGALVSTAAGNTTDYVAGISHIGGDAGASWYHFGYISNLHVNKGTALYTSTFTPSTTPLTAIANTSLLTCQSTTMIDNSNNAFAITVAGDTKPNRNNPFGYTTSALQSYDTVVHGGSAYFDGTGDYLATTGSTAYTFGTGDFTVELWVYLTTIGASYRQFAGTATSSAGFAFGLGGSNKLYITTSTVGTESSGTALVAGQWYHCAWTRSSGTVRMFLNGILDNTTAGLTTNITETGGIIGGQAANYFMNGYISNLRVLKGQALYTSSFVPPLTPLTAIKNTTLLLDSKPAILDYSMMNNLETAGNAQLSTSIKKYGSASMYFDGTGDYLTVPNNVNLQFGTGDFTVEFWAYVTGGSSWRAFVSKGAANTGWSVIINDTGYWAFSDTVNNYGGSVAVTNNSWTHIAFTRSGTTTKLFVNGTQAYSVTLSTNYNQTNQLVIGAGRDTTIPITGYIDDLRITKGYARYTSAFTPPAAALDVK